MDELHQLSAILIERETIDKDQFERLLPGEAEESIFAGGDAASGRGGARAGAGEEAAAPAVAAPASGRGDAAAAGSRGVLGGIRRARQSWRGEHDGERRERPGGFDREPLDAREVGNREQRPRQAECPDPRSGDPPGRRHAFPGSSRARPASSRAQPRVSPTTTSAAATPAARVSSGGSSIRSSAA